jgi:hypothetical protein
MLLDLSTFFFLRRTTKYAPRIQTRTATPATSPEDNGRHQKNFTSNSRFNSSIRKIEITYYNASVRAFTSNICPICQNKESDKIEHLKSN